MRGKTLDYLAVAFVGIFFFLLFINKYGMNIIGKPTCECLPSDEYEISPKGYYRIQTCISKFFGKSLIHGFDSPQGQGYYKVFNNRTGELIAESDFIEFRWGRIFWPTKEKHVLQIGIDFSVTVPPEPEN